MKNSRQRTITGSSSKSMFGGYFMLYNVKRAGSVSKNVCWLRNKQKGAGMWEEKRVRNTHQWVIIFQPPLCANVRHDVAEMGTTGKYGLVLVVWMFEEIQVTKPLKPLKSRHVFYSSVNLQIEFRIRWLQ